MTLYCSQCGQRVLLRLGIQLSPKRADVFDAIRRQSKYGGIRGDALKAMFGSINVVRVHISHINKALAATPWQIICEREGSAKGFYRIRRKRHAQKNARRSGQALPALRSAADVVPLPSSDSGPAAMAAAGLGVAVPAPARW